MIKKNIDRAIDHLFTLKPIMGKNLFYHPDFRNILSPGSHLVLILLQKYKTLTMTDLGEKLCIPKPNVTKLIDKLICDGIAERITNLEDRRVINISLTRKGYQLRKNVNNKIRAGLKDKLALLSEKEITKLTGSLQNVIDIISKLQ